MASNASLEDICAKDVHIYVFICEDVFYIFFRNLKIESYIISTAAMSRTSWTTYDWSRHDASHYTNDSEMLYGAQFISPDWQRIGLVRVKGFSHWQLPFTTHLQDGERPLQAVNRSVRTHFNLVDGEYTLNYVIDNEGVFETVSRASRWGEDDLNTHIREQRRLGKRPFWNKPGDVMQTSEYYLVFMNPEDACAHKLADTIEEMRFFTSAEMTDIKEEMLYCDISALAWFMPHHEPTAPDAPYNYEVRTSAIMTVVVSLAVVIVALVTATTNTT